MDKDYHELPIIGDAAPDVQHAEPALELPEPANIEKREVGSQRAYRSDAHERQERSLDIAMICHEANRAYCITIGDFTQRPWSQAPAWQQDSAINGAQAHISAIEAGREMTPRESHESWLKQKAEEGWSYGPVKDVVNKTHPCFVPYDQLPEAQRRKDVLFGAIVKALAGPL